MTFFSPKEKTIKSVDLRSGWIRVLPAISNPIFRREGLLTPICLIRKICFEFFFKFSSKLDRFSQLLITNRSIPPLSFSIQILFVVVFPWDELLLRLFTTHSNHAIQSFVFVFLFHPIIKNNERQHSIGSSSTHQTSSSSQYRSSICLSARSFIICIFDGNFSLAFHFWRN